jgi:hypothetical protein
MARDLSQEKEIRDSQLLFDLGIDLIEIQGGDYVSVRPVGSPVLNAYCIPWPVWLWLKPLLQELHALRGCEIRVYETVGIAEAAASGWEASMESQELLLNTLREMMKALDERQAIIEAMKVLTLEAIRR